MAEPVPGAAAGKVGQMSLADVLAVAGAARKLVLLGDSQLAPPSQATHPVRAGALALGHILTEQATMPEGAGLLLEQTYRMHPKLCCFTSEVFYDEKLYGVDRLGLEEICARRRSPGGLANIEVLRQGTGGTRYEKRAEQVALLAAMFASCSWRDRDDDAGRPIWMRRHLDRLVQRTDPG